MECEEQACQFPTKKGFHLGEKDICSEQISTTPCGKFPNFNTPSLWINHSSLDSKKFFPISLDKKKLNDIIGLFDLIGRMVQSNNKGT
jgi:hypothetical protein